VAVCGASGVVLDALLVLLLVPIASFTVAGGGALWTLFALNSLCWFVLLAVGLMAVRRRIYLEGADARLISCGPYMAMIRSAGAPLRKRGSENPHATARSERRARPAVRYHEMAMDA